MISSSAVWKITEVPTNTYDILKTILSKKLFGKLMQLKLLYIYRETIIVYKQMTQVTEVCITITKLQLSEI